MFFWDPVLYEVQSMEDSSRELWYADYMSMMDDEYDDPGFDDDPVTYAAEMDDPDTLYSVTEYDEDSEGFGFGSVWPEDLREDAVRMKQIPDDGSVSTLPSFMRLRDFDLPDSGTGKVKVLKRDLRMEALKRIEDAARTVADFKKVIEWYDGLEANERSRVGKHEILRSGDEYPLDYGTDENGAIFPANLGSVIARQMRKGDFLDYLYCRPDTLDQIVTTDYLIHFMRGIEPKYRHLFYWKVLEKASTTEIAKMKGQTARAVRESWRTLDHHLKQRTMGVLIFRSDKDYSFTGDEQRFFDTCREKYEYRPESEPELDS